ncbi:MAG TPA: hypothetical protein VFH51_00025, partial [Myxococcota bacterium]|nr:hypothetical protein [Myxococcota bacterium]
MADAIALRPLPLPLLLDGVVVAAATQPQSLTGGHRGLFRLGHRVVTVDERHVVRGAAAAFGTALGATFLGVPRTALHEFVGHLRLGGPLVYTYVNGTPPSDFQIDNHFFGGGSCKPEVGVNGVTSWGARLGAEQRVAWVALAGTVPCYATDVLLGAGGALLGGRGRALLGALALGTGFGMFIQDGLYYPGTTASLTDTTIRQVASGNDFVAWGV